jgi:hypothetical protein
MTKNADSKGESSRLWSVAGREKGRRETDQQSAQTRTEEKGMPLFGQDRAYVAFKLRDGAERLQIIRATKPARFPAASYLLDISYDHFHQSAFSLIYTFMVVDVTGWNLEPVVHAINFGNCDNIREFDPRQHDHPGKGEPLIETINITAADEERKK